MVYKHSSNRNLIPFLSLLDHQSSTKNIIVFTPSHLLNSVGLVLPIKWKISSLHLTINFLLDTSILEQIFTTLEQEDEDA